MNNSASGQSLIDVVIAMGVGLIISLGVGAIVTFGMEQFNMLRNQNLAQESLLQAGFEFRVKMSNAVKTYCCSRVSSCNVSGGKIPLAYTPRVPGAGFPNPYQTIRLPDGTDFIPTTIPVGVVDCRPVNIASLATWTDPVQPFALFVRENGSGTTSDYRSTGIFFQKPAGTEPGIIYFADSDGTVELTPSTGGVFFSNVVNMGVDASDPSALKEAPIDTNSAVDMNQTTGALENATGALQGMNIRIRVRYFTKITDPAQISYAPDKVNGSPNIFRDVDVVVNIPFRNNILGYTTSGVSTTTERIHGGIYYYKFDAPRFKTSN
ncbi:MAG: hypothetical protein SGI74_01815 [Oligoflexia bacterium]|nr:hypothetical protein [Oligoflexia bacterium]